MYEDFLLFPDEYKEELKKQNKKLKKEFEKQNKQNIKKLEKELDEWDDIELDFEMFFEDSHILIILGLGILISIVRMLFLFKKSGFHLWVFKRCLGVILTSFIGVIIFVSIVWILFKVLFYKKKKDVDKKMDILFYEGDNNINFKTEEKEYIRQYYNKLPEVCYSIFSKNKEIKELPEKICKEIFSDIIVRLDSLNEYEEVVLAFEVNKNEILYSGEVIYEFTNNLSSAIEVTATAIVLVSQLQLILMKKIKTEICKNYFYAKLTGYTKSQIIVRRKMIL